MTDQPTPDQSSEDQTPDETPGAPRPAGGVRGLMGRFRRTTPPSPAEDEQPPEDLATPSPLADDDRDSGDEDSPATAPPAFLTPTGPTEPALPASSPLADESGDEGSPTPEVPSAGAVSEPTEPPLPPPFPLTGEGGDEGSPAPEAPSPVFASEPTEPPLPAPSSLAGESWGEGALPAAAASDAPDADADADADPDPESESESEPEPEIAPEPRVRRRHAGISAHLVVLGGLATAVILAFLLIEPSPRWVLLLGAGSVVIGLDGTLRQTWRQPFTDGAETSAYLFVPALYMLAVPVVIEHNVPGELVILVGLLAGLGFAALAWAETASVRPQAPEYATGRVVVTAGTYVAGFSVFSLTYVFDVSLATAVLAVGLASTMLAMEVLREGEIDPLETLGFAVVTGVIMAQARLLMYYVPLDTYLAGLTLLLAFYLTTGLLHSHITRAFSWPLSVEYGGIAAAGLGLVVVARAAGLA